MSFYRNICIMRGKFNKIEKCNCNRSVTVSAADTSVAVTSVKDDYVEYVNNQSAAVFIPDTSAMSDYYAAAIASQDETTLMNTLTELPAQYVYQSCRSKKRRIFQNACCFFNRYFRHSRIRYSIC